MENKDEANSNYRLKIPLNELMQNRHDFETYKQLTGITVGKVMTSYQCITRVYAIFFSDSEIDISKSEVLKAFTGINSVPDFLQLGLPLASYSTPTVDRSTDFNDIDPMKKAQTLTYEIDVSNVKALARVLNIRPSKMDCYPLLWCLQEKVEGMQWSFKISQRIAFKYSVVKLIDRNPGVEQ